MLNQVFPLLHVPCIRCVALCSYTIDYHYVTLGIPDIHNNILGNNRCVAISLSAVQYASGAVEAQEQHSNQPQ